MTTLGLGQSKFWCFTLNNCHNYDALNNILNWEYMVAGKEVGANGTPHLQCFVAYKVRTKFSTVKNQIPRAHIEKMGQFSTPKKAADYCKKEGDFMEFGELPDWRGGKSGGEAKAANFRAMIAAAKSGDLDGVEELNPVAYVQHYHAFKRIVQDHPAACRPLDDVCGIWYVGEPGVGKSHKARADYPNFYDKAINKWWDGYQGEDAVILDDLDLVHHVLGHHLKRWADKYPFPAEQKGTTVQIRPKNIIVTSNYTIEEIFTQGGDVLVSALKRRFEVIRVLDWRLGMSPIAPPVVPIKLEHVWVDASDEEDSFELPTGIKRIIEISSDEEDSASDSFID